MDETPEISFVAAGWLLKDEELEAFVRRNGEALSAVPSEVVIVADRVSPLPYPHRCLRYPLPQAVFSLSKTTNFGIRRASGRIVVKTDVDIVFSAASVLHISKTVRTGRALACFCSLLQNCDWVKSTDWKQAVPFTRGYGACLAMTKEDWHRHCGYDERLEGWGGEDVDLVRRLQRAGELVESSEHPMYHIAHPHRKGSAHFPDRNAGNLSFGRNRGHDWAGKDWGLPQLP